jgi:hypothetical protein
LASWAKASYSRLPARDKVEFELLYAAADYSRVGLVATNLVFAQNVIATMAAPQFEVNFHSDTGALGYAKSIDAKDVLRARSDLLGIGAEEFGVNFQAGVVVTAYGDMMARISGEPVGGLFTIARVDARGVTWFPYSQGDILGLAIVGRRFVQFDNRGPVPKKFPLLGVWEFDTRRPLFEDMYVRAPALGAKEDPAA